VGGPGGFELGTSPEQPAREPAARTTRLGGGCCFDRSSAPFEVYIDLRGAPLCGAPRIT
jgi:hypothetical protein